MPVGDMDVQSALVAGGAVALTFCLWKQQQQLQKLEQQLEQGRRIIPTMKPSNSGGSFKAIPADRTPSPGKGATTPRYHSVTPPPAPAAALHGPTPNEDFVPHHISANHEDMKGNGKAGRYFFVPGSSGRAAKIADAFDRGSVVVRKTARGHDVHLGKLKGVDVGSVATGMGCPSVDIIVTELIKLGAKRFIRVGTAGSVQPKDIRVGSVVIGTGGVRDEGTSRNYAPPEFPAVASPLLVLALEQAAREMGIAENVYSGIIHAKDSLYAREFKEGTYAPEHAAYMRTLQNLGVVASEMEASLLYTLAHVHGKQTHAVSEMVGGNEILCGVVCGIVGDDSPFADSKLQAAAVETAIKLALQGVGVLDRMEKEGLKALK